jgi:hypothetical protein
MTAPRAMHASVFPARAIRRFLRAGPTLVIPRTILPLPFPVRIDTSAVLSRSIPYHASRVAHENTDHDAPTANRSLLVVAPLFHLAPYERLPSAHLIRVLVRQRMTLR